MRRGSIEQVYHPLSLGILNDITNEFVSAKLRIYEKSNQVEFIDMPPGKRKETTRSFRSPGYFSLVMPEL